MVEEIPSIQKAKQMILTLLSNLSDSVDATSEFHALTFVIERELGTVNEATNTIQSETEFLQSVASALDRGDIAQAKLAIQSRLAPLARNLKDYQAVQAFWQEVSAVLEIDSRYPPSSDQFLRVLKLAKE